MKKSVTNVTNVTNVIKNGLNERKFKAFDIEVTIKDLSIRDMLGLEKVPEQDQLFYMVSKCLVEPKMTEDELKDLGSIHLDSLTSILAEVTPQK